MTPGKRCSPAEIKPRCPVRIDGEEGAFSISSLKLFVPNHAQPGTQRRAQHQLQLCLEMEIQSIHLAIKEDNVRK